MASPTIAARRACRRGSTGSRIEIAIDADAGTDRPSLQLGSKDAAFGAIELRDRLGKALARLPANYRALIAAHYLKGVQYEELADAFGLPLGTVKTHLHRAKRELRKLLEGELA